LGLSKAWMNLGVVAALLAALYVALIWLVDPRFRETLRAGLGHARRLLNRQRAGWPAVEPPAK